MATHEEMESAFGVKGVGKLKKGFGKNKVGVFEDFNGDLLAGGSFTEFLHSGGLEIEEQFCRAEMGLVYSPSFSHKPSVHQEHASKMLSFHTNQNRTEMGFWETGDTATAMAQKSVISGSDSSSTSSSNNSRSRSWTAESGEATTEPKRRNGLEPGSGSVSGSATGSLVHGSEDNRITFKKPKRESAICTGTLKVRKEKLGERISALQQLVSPFGKTDTASVLHEAIGYIRFLHDQVQVLSSPYLQITPSSNISPGDWGEENKYDLRSRGLCLVPVACTLHVASSNGADFWASAMGRSASKH